MLTSPPRGTGMKPSAIAPRPAILHRRFRRVIVPPVRAPAPRLRPLAIQALWMGLVGGLLELGIHLGHGALVGTVTGVSVFLSKYYLPLGLAAHLAIAAAWL